MPGGGGEKGAQREKKKIIFYKKNRQKTKTSWATNPHLGKEKFVLGGEISNQGYQNTLPKFLLLSFYKREKFFIPLFASRK